MKKIKVLIIAGTMNLGGIENQMMHLLRKADPNHFQIDFTSTLSAPYYRREMEARGSRCIVIPEMKITNPFPYCYRLYRIMKEGGYNIVHSHELFHSGIVLLCAYLAGVKGRFCHAHNWQDGTGDAEKRSLIRSIYNHIMGSLIRRFSTHQLACSTTAAKFLYGEDWLLQDSFHLVFNSVDTGRFLNARRESPPEDPDGWINVLHVGRVTSVKNQLFLTRIAAIFRQRSRNIRFLCAGGGDAPYIEKIQTAIADLGVEKHIRLLGPREDIPQLMAAASAFVLPSKYEGMPLVVIEAQSAGLSCVCADTFSHEVDFGLGSIHWMSLSDSPDLWADAIEEAIASGKRREAEILPVIQEKGFDSAFFSETLCRLYTSAVKGEAP